MKISVAIAHAQAQVVADAVTGGALRIYSGTRPASPETAVTDQVLLAELAIPSPAGTVSGNVLTFGAIGEDNSANATGIPAWGRLFTAGAEAVADFSVGGTGEIAGMASMTAGQRVVIDGLSYTVPLGT